MKHIKKYEKNQIEYNKKICDNFLLFVNNYFSEITSFVKAFNDSKNYEDFDDIVYMFDGIENDINDKSTTLQFILEYLRKIGWYDENFQIVPMIENNKLYVSFYLSHQYDEMYDILLKLDTKKFNL